VLGTPSAQAAFRALDDTCLMGVQYSVLDMFPGDSAMDAMTTTIGGPDKSGQILWDPVVK
jgi:hypothetical protein